MKVKILVSLGFVDAEDNNKTYSPAPGQIADIPKKFAEEFIRIGYAEAVTDKTVNDPLPDEGEPAPKPRKR